MNDTDFRQKYYGPYSDVWKCLKIIQHARKKFDDAELEKANDAVWERYIEEVKRLGEYYKDNQFALDLIDLLIKYDDVIARENQKLYGSE